MAHRSALVLTLVHLSVGTWSSALALGRSAAPLLSSAAGRVPPLTQLPSECLSQLDDFQQQPEQYLKWCCGLSKNLRADSLDVLLAKATADRSEEEERASASVLSSARDSKLVDALSDFSIRDLDSSAMDQIVDSLLEFVKGEDEAAVASAWALGRFAERAGGFRQGEIVSALLARLQSASSLSREGYVKAIIRVLARLAKGFPDGSDLHRTIIDAFLQLVRADTNGTSGPDIPPKRTRLILFALTDLAKNGGTRSNEIGQVLLEHTE